MAHLTYSGTGSSRAAGLKRDGFPNISALDMDSVVKNMTTSCASSTSVDERSLSYDAIPQVRMLLVWYSECRLEP